MNYRVVSTLELYLQLVKTEIKAGLFGFILSIVALSIKLKVKLSTFCQGRSMGDLE